MTTAAMTAAARDMFARDRASRAAGMQIEAAAGGYARLTLTVREDMLNGHNICHGGVLFMLADSAFAFASNADNHLVVAAGCDIEYFRPAHLGDKLIATCRLRQERGRTNYYDVDIVNSDGEAMAIFRGRGRVIDGVAAAATQKKDETAI